MLVWLSRVSQWALLLRKSRWSGETSSTDFLKARQAETAHHVHKQQRHAYESSLLMSESNVVLVSTVRERSCMSSRHDWGNMVWNVMSSSVAGAAQGERPAQLSERSSRLPFSRIVVQFHARRRLGFPDCEKQSQDLPRKQATKRPPFHQDYLSLACLSFSLLLSSHMVNDPMARTSPPQYSIYDVLGHAAVRKSISHVISFYFTSRHST